MWSRSGSLAITSRSCRGTIDSGLERQTELLERQLNEIKDSPIARISLPISCDVLLAREGSDAFPPMETPLVHHAARRRGSDVAARGAGAGAESQLS